MPSSAACISAGIDTIGIVAPTTVHKNLTYDELRAHETQGREGVVTAHGSCLSVDTGRFTGRSPQDKYIVRRPGSESDANVWWGDVNQPMKPEIFDELFARAVDHFNSRDSCYVSSHCCGYEIRAADSTLHFRAMMLAEASTPYS